MIIEDTLGGTNTEYFKFKAQNKEKAQWKTKLDFI